MTVQEWLGKDNTLGIQIWEKKYRYNNETLDQFFDRVSGGDKELRKLISEKKFLFGGRTLSNRGTGESGSYFNCYSSGFAPDDYDGLLELNKNLGITYKAQGGQGVSLSKLRPKGTPIGKRYFSDGIVNFMEIFNTTTKETSQGGARKGALMISLDIRHKEAETFIKLKSEIGKIEKANLSLEIDDEFMNAVDEYYQSGKVITLHEVRDYSGHKIEYDIVPINLYKMLVQNCYDWADPACLFTNRFRNYNLMEFDDEYNIETSNPCGEQPLPPNFCCNLGSLNLAEFVNKPFTNKASFNFKQFYDAIYIAIKALDDIIDENANNHPLIQQKENSLNYRNVGLGVFGYASALMKLGITYGSSEALSFTENLFNNLFICSVEASVDLARIKGAYPKYKTCVFDSQIIKNHFSESDIEVFKTIGIRNCSLVSIAPTGSISTMFGETGGCEPEFAIKYTRKTESLDNGKEKYFDVFCKTAQEYINVTGYKELPSYFIESAKIDWKNRVETQAIMQKHVDTAISSTVNLPESTKIEDVEQLYLQAWKSGLKGITIFRNGCKKFGILTTSEPQKKEKQSEYEEISADDLPRGYIETVPTDLVYRKYKLKTGCGYLYFFLGVDDDGKIYDCFCNTDGNSGCVINTQAVSRLISLAIRVGAPIKKIIDQLEKAGTCPSYSYHKGKGESLSKGKSCSSSIANIIREVVKEFEDLEKEELYEKEETESVQVKNPCPECGEELKFEGGCQSCVSCGWSKCG